MILIINKIHRRKINESIAKNCVLVLYCSNTWKYYTSYWSIASMKIVKLVITFILETVIATSTLTHKVVSCTLEVIC